MQILINTLTENKFKIGGILTEKDDYYLSTYKMDRGANF